MFEFFSPREIQSLALRMRNETQGIRDEALRHGRGDIAALADAKLPALERLCRLTLNLTTAIA